MASKTYSELHRQNSHSGLGVIFFLVVIILFCISGCARHEIESPAVLQTEELNELSTLDPYSQGPGRTLFLDAQELLSQGRNVKAELAMERALRIEPSNPAYWYFMAKVKHRQGQNSQAIQFCLKSQSLTGKNSKLHNLNRGLIRSAGQNED